MSVLGWVIIGLVAGWLAGEVMQGHGFGLLGNIIVGILGALLGGWLFNNVLGLTNGVDGVNLGSLITAFLGSVILLSLVGLIRRPPPGDY